MGIFVFMETKINSQKANVFIKSLYPNFIEIPPDGLAAGLWVI